MFVAFKSADRERQGRIWRWRGTVWYGVPLEVFHCRVEYNAIQRLIPEQNSKKKKKGVSIFERYILNFVQLVLKLSIIEIKSAKKETFLQQ